MAKTQALLRRTYAMATELNVLHWGEVQLLAAEAYIQHKEKSLSLTRTELQIMDALFRAQGRYVSRETLMERCWAGNSYIDDNTLAVNMTRLRKKLAQLELVRLIVTKKAVGYALAVLNEDEKV